MVALRKATVNLLGIFPKNRDFFSRKQGSLNSLIPPPIDTYHPTNGDNIKGVFLHSLIHIFSKKEQV